MISSRSYCNLCSTKRTIWTRELGLNPLHDTIVVENMLAWCLSNHCRWCKFFDTNGTTFLILFEGRLRVLLPRQLLANQCQLLFVLLFQNSLSCHWIMHPISKQVLIVNRVLNFGSILAEDAETGATAKHA